MAFSGARVVPSADVGRHLQYGQAVLIPLPNGACDGQAARELVKSLDSTPGGGLLTLTDPSGCQIHVPVQRLNGSSADSTASGMPELRHLQSELQQRAAHQLRGEQLSLPALQLQLEEAAASEEEGQLPGKSSFLLMPATDLGSLPLPAVEMSVLQATSGGQLGADLLRKCSEAVHSVELPASPPALSSGAADDPDKFVCLADDLEELDEFAKHFRERRIELGFRQSDVGPSLFKLCGCKIAQSTISRFEALTLNMSNILYIKPVLQAWLHKVESKAGGDATAAERDDVLKDAASLARAMARPYQRKYNRLEESVQSRLEAFFLESPKPHSEEQQMMAEELSIEVEVLKKWFVARRAKMKRAPVASRPREVAI